MNVFTMVAVICIAAAVTPVAIVWVVAQSRRSAADRRFRTRLAPLEERVRTLEALLTDPDRRLARDIAAL